VTSYSQTTGYAIEALACLARHAPDSMLVREIACITEIPLPYLSKIFQRLVEAGVVESKRGYKGGVRLTRSPDEISLLEINSAAESGKSGETGEESARPGTFWQAFHQSYRDKLAAMTLADVVDYEGHHELATS
jgi:Rrf2 family protein